MLRGEVVLELTSTFNEPVRIYMLVCFGCFFFIAFIAAFVFQMRPYLTNSLFKLGYTCLNILFVYLIVVYTIAAVYPI